MYPRDRRRKTAQKARWLPKLTPTIRNSLLKLLSCPISSSNSISDVNCHENIISGPKKLKTKIRTEPTPLQCLKVLVLTPTHYHQSALPHGATVVRTRGLGGHRRSPAWDSPTHETTTGWAVHGLLDRAARASGSTGTKASASRRPWMYKNQFLTHKRNGFFTHWKRSLFHEAIVWIDVMNASWTCWSLMSIYSNIDIWSSFARYSVVSTVSLSFRCELASFSSTISPSNALK